MNSVMPIERLVEEIKEEEKIGDSSSVINKSSMSVGDSDKACN